MSKKDSVLRICLPGPDHWELWASNAVGFQLERTAGGGGGDPGSPADFRGADILGIPAVGAFSVPLWISSDDPAVVQSVIDIQLETLGIKPAAFEGRHVDSQIVDRDGSRTLLHVTVLSERYPLDLPKTNPGSFEVTPNLYFLSEDRITIWKELGALVLAITRGDRVIYFQALTADVMTVDVVREIQCILLPLQAQRIADQIKGVTAWLDDNEAPESALAFLRSATEYEVERGVRPAPAKPQTTSVLLPQQVAERQRLARRRGRIRAGVLAAAAVYLAIIGFLAADFFVQRSETARLESEARRLQPLAGWIPGMRSQWTLMQPSVDVDVYPVETLLRLYEHLPPQGVRFTKLTITRSSVMLTGEAKDTVEAAKYMNAVRSDPALSRFEWDNLPPRMGRDRITNFQLNGSLRDALTET